jgi:flavin reductase (DIM6/NTAB) family NADH-FMN oxidoreductase RutF
MNAGTRAPGEHADVAAAFRDSMSMVASTVVLATTQVNGRPWGMTITACCSISADPPTVLISLASSTVSAKAIRETGCYGVNVLSSSLPAIDVARFGSAPGAPKFLDECEDLIVPGNGESPCVRGALAYLDCDVTDVVESGDHSLFVGLVREVSFPADGGALVYCYRQYQRVSPILDIVRTPESEHQLAYSAW